MTTAPIIAPILALSNSDNRDIAKKERVMNVKMNREKIKKESDF
jgi:hypothetical protein